MKMKTMREKVRGGVRVMCTKNGIYCEKEKKSRGGVTVDVNGEVRLL